MVQKKTKKIEILQAGNPILRQVSSAVPVSKIKTAEIIKTIVQLKSAIDSQADAAAISAIQIGKPIRLFVIAKKIFGIDINNPDKNKDKKDLIFINPKIIKTSKTKQLLEEIGRAHV